MAGSFATTSIITKGLHKGPACTGVITSRFSLYCNVAPPVVVPPPPSGGGGPYPGSAWNKITDIHDFFTPTKEQVYEVPRDQEADYFRKNLTITLRVKLGDTNVEKVYSVPEKRVSSTVRVFNMMNATQARMAVTIRNVKRVVHRIKVNISRLRVVKQRNKD